VKTVATEGAGVAELAATIAQYEAFLQKNGLLLQKKTESWRQRLVEMLREALLARVLKEQMGDGAVARYAAEVAEHRRDPYTLVDEIVRKLGKS
jgi:LAO/AO transport system kinase